MAEKTTAVQVNQIVEGAGLEISKAKYILDEFTDFFNAADGWTEKAKSIVITDASQTAEMKMAREGRLALKAIRASIENKRKALKEQSLREGKAIDGIANVLKAVIVPIEEHFEQQEKFVAIQEARKAEELRAQRTAELTPYGWHDTGSMDIGRLDEVTYNIMLTGLKKAHDDRIEAERKAEEARIAKEKAEAAERERIRKENERLCKEKEVAEEEARKEREAKERELAEQRKKADAEREKMEAERRKEREEAARKQRDSDEKARKDREAAAAKQKAIEDKAAKEREELEARLAAQVECPFCHNSFIPGQPVHEEATV